MAKVDGLAILGSSAPERVHQLSSGRTFAVQPSIETESTYNAKEAYRLGGRKVVVVFFENDFSRAHEEAFRLAFQKVRHPTARFYDIAKREKKHLLGIAPSPRVAERDERK